MSAIEAKAQLKLNLRADEEHALKGWWVAAGANAPDVGVGVLLILSPEIAQKTADKTLTHDEMVSLVTATFGCFERAMLQAAGFKMFDPEKN